MPKAVADLRAKYSASGNAIIPNTFQHPNIFVDKLMYLLTPSENVVLTYAVRRILGFQANMFTRKDNISLSQFTDGIITSQSGEWLSHGCGLGTETVINALDALCEYKILLPTTEKPDPKRGQEYWLQDDENKIDWDGLEKRRNEKSIKYRKQTNKARYSVEQRGSVEQTGKPSVEQNPSPLLNRDTKPTETHGNPDMGADAPPAEFPIDWKLGHNQKIAPPTEQEQFERTARDIANKIDFQCAGAGELALAFMLTRNIHLPDESDKIKAHRKACREMLKQKVKGEHIKQAVRKLLDGNMTVTDLFSVQRTAIDLANPAPQTEKNDDQPKQFPKFINGVPVFEGK